LLFSVGGGVHLGDGFSSGHTSPLSGLMWYAWRFHAVARHAINFRLRAGDMGVAGSSAVQASADGDRGRWVVFRRSYRRFC